MIATIALCLSVLTAKPWQEILESCVFLFVKHPYDPTDLVLLPESEKPVVVHKVTLLTTIFRNDKSDESDTGTRHVPNSRLNSLPIVNKRRVVEPKSYYATPSVNTPSAKPIRRVQPDKLP